MVQLIALFPVLERSLGDQRKGHGHPFSVPGKTQSTDSLGNQGHCGYKPLKAFFSVTGVVIDSSIVGIAEMELRDSAMPPTLWEDMSEAASRFGFGLFDPTFLSERDTRNG